jgi:PAS domain S-box-containing protein
VDREQIPAATTDIVDEQRYRLLVDAISDYAIFMLDPSGHVASWNEGARRFKGYEAEEILGRHFSCFYTEEERTAGRPEQVLATAAREGSYEHEGWRVRKDGECFWASVVVDPIRSESGELLGFAKITRDLTDRRQAEQELRQSQEQFRLLVQRVVDYAIYTLDTSGHITNWNLGAERIKGYHADEIIGQHFASFYTEEDRAAGLPESSLAEARREGRYASEGWRVRKDGSRFWASVVIDAIHDDDGALVGFAKITRDVTPQREAQQALDAAREALFQTQKLETIGQLSGGVAHDFNNLLMVIVGSLQLLQKLVPDDPKIHALLNNALAGAERGSSLTQRMLAFARRQQLRLESVDLLDLVRGMSDLLKRSLGPTVQIETRFPIGLPPVKADTNQLEMALLNLATNGRDAMQGHGQLTIAAREIVVDGEEHGQLIPGHYVALSVIDSGDGMDDETLARALDPFFTTKGVGKGTGLGLPMVHGLAQQSGGQLVLRSVRGEGTTAELWLPVATEAVQPNPDAAEAEPLRRAERPSVVLVVDDDPLVLQGTAALLEDLGYQAVLAASGASALALLQDGEQIDLVLTDYAMPQMNGGELATAIHDIQPQLPILIASGYAEPLPDTVRALPRLDKPFRQEALGNALHALLNPA